MKAKGCSKASNQLRAILLILRIQTMNKVWFRHQLPTKEITYFFDSVLIALPSTQGSTNLTNDYSYFSILPIIL